MEYLKVVSVGNINISCNYFTAKEFDSHGYKVRFKVAEGSVKVFTELDNYTLGAGEIIEFVGKLKYHGNANIEYILFDRV